MIINNDACSTLGAYYVWQWRIAMWLLAEVRWSDDGSSPPSIAVSSQSGTPPVLETRRYRGRCPEWQTGHSSPKLPAGHPSDCRSKHSEPGRPFARILTSGLSLKGSLSVGEPPAGLHVPDSLELRPGQSPEPTGYPEQKISANQSVGYCPRHRFPWTFLLSLKTSPASQPRVGHRGSAHLADNGIPARVQAEVCGYCQRYLEAKDYRDGLEENLSKTRKTQPAGTSLAFLHKLNAPGLL
ncbi:hypothetical protein O181_082584 [Austropuccinia psidii MF-1]|uniref:Uncharacterized protein n=1 Tax=Austropuccinia psidii MF-1 TaxID=1389203 RepID=A0A9Q3FPY7_9BASI|nr:hypothetical protein [Austropuccinia psidii MF-1]